MKLEARSGLDRHAVPEPCADIAVRDTSSMHSRRPTISTASSVDNALCADLSARLAMAKQPLREAASAASEMPLAATDLIADAVLRITEQACASESGLARDQLLSMGSRLVGALGALSVSSAPPVSLGADRQQALPGYERYGSAAIVDLERSCRRMLGLGDTADIGLLMTNSGMAAYAVIESFLLRQVLRPQDCVLLHPGIYFETEEQIRSLPHLRVSLVAGWTADHILSGITACRPAVVFVDAMTNTAELRLLDLPALLDAAERICDRETWFVVDGTMMSGACDPFAGSARRQNVRVLYYESGAKYLQFGLDLGCCGVVAAEAPYMDRLGHQRRNLGAVISTAQAAALPRAARAIYLRHMALMSASAAAAAAAAAAAEFGDDAVRPVFPGLASHPDHARLGAYAHLGGVLSFCFAAPSARGRSFLESLAVRVLEQARRAHLPLTVGTSFGFRSPRLSVAWAASLRAPPFLRLSAGLDADLATELGRLVVREARALCATA